MRLPNTVPADSLSDFYYKDQVRINGRWYIAKSKGMSCLCLMKRVKMAWAVFTGKSDVLEYKKVN